MRCLVIALALTCLAAADIRRFQPPPEMGNTLTVDGAAPLFRNQYSATAWLSYARNPLVWRYADGSFEPVIGNQLMLDVGFAAAIHSRVALGVVVPVVLWQTGRLTQGRDTLKMRGATAGDVRLHAHIGLLSERAWRVGLAFVPEFTLPTGAVERFVGDPGATFRPRFVVAIPHLLGATRFETSLGYLVRKNAAIADVTFGDLWTLGAATQTPLLDGPLPTDLLLELVIDSSASKPWDGHGQFASEARAALALNAAATRTTLGAGLGLSRGLGIPDFRLFMGVGFLSSAPDSDGDGLPDPADDCPLSPEDFDNFQDGDGCPEWDNDGDEIADEDDGCPTLPEDDNGIADDDGCPDRGVVDKDSDVDGVKDREDKCPTQKETINGVDDWDGCPDEGEGSTRYIQNIKIEIVATVQFETGKATIQPVSKPILDQVALQILAHPEVRKVRVEGHTDSMGPEEDNLYLSQDRADAVRRYLMGRGVEKGRLVAVGFGETQPIDTNNTVAGRTKNRRVEFVIVE